jgi:hypothetical protein
VVADERVLAEALCRTQDRCDGTCPDVEGALAIHGKYAAEVLAAMTTDDTRQPCASDCGCAGARFVDDCGFEPGCARCAALVEAQRAINLVQNRLWSMRRAMDLTFVEDHEIDRWRTRAVAIAAIPVVFFLVSVVLAAVWRATK